MNFVFVIAVRLPMFQHLKKKLQQIDPEATIKIGCQNLCGIGRTKSFAVVNHIPIIAESEEALVEKIKQQLHK